MNTIKKIVIVFLFLSFYANADENEIKKAKEGAPAHISEKASIYKWKKQRFVKIKEGSNPFSCLVLRDPKGRYEPSCLNQAAMESVLPVYEYQTYMLEQGKTIQEIYKNIEKKAASGEFKAPKPGALVYMMAPDNKFYDYWNEKMHDIKPHIMMYFPKIDAESLGFNGKAGLPGFYQEYPHLSVVHIEHNNMPGYGSHSH